MRAFRHLTGPDEPRRIVRVWEPHDPVSYFAHVIFGIIAYGAGITALAVTKGSRKHVLAGRVFAVGMIVPALTALIFFLEMRFPLIVFQSLAVLYLVPSGILALRVPSRHRTYDGLLSIVPLALCGAGVAQTSRVLAQGTAALQLFGPLLFATIFGSLFLSDLRRLVSAADRSPDLRRHLVRMNLAFAFATMAVLREAIPLGLAFELTVILPLALVLPFILYHYRRIQMEDQGSRGTGLRRVGSPDLS